MFVKGQEFSLCEPRIRDLVLMSEIQTLQSIWKSPISQPMLFWLIFKTCDLLRIWGNFQKISVYFVFVIYSTK